MLSTSLRGWEQVGEGLYCSRLRGEHGILARLKDDGSRSRRNKARKKMGLDIAGCAGTVGRVVDCVDGQDGEEFGRKCDGQEGRDDRQRAKVDRGACSGSGISNPFSYPFLRCLAACLTVEEK